MEKKNKHFLQRMRPHGGGASPGCPPIAAVSRPLRFQWMRAHGGGASPGCPPWVLLSSPPVRPQSCRRVARGLALFLFNFEFVGAICQILCGCTTCIGESEANQLPLPASEPRSWGNFGPGVESPSILGGGGIFTPLFLVKFGA